MFSLFTFISVLLEWICCWSPHFCYMHIGLEEWKGREFRNRIEVINPLWLCKWGELLHMNLTISMLNEAKKFIYLWYCHWLRSMSVETYKSWNHTIIPLDTVLIYSHLWFRHFLSHTIYVIHQPHSLGIVYHFGLFFVVVLFFLWFFFFFFWIHLVKTSHI